MIPQESNRESIRIIQAYEKRKESVSVERYSFFNDGNRFITQRLEWDVLKLLKKQNVNSLIDKKILDVGCGTGGELRNFLRYGAQPENLFGIDLLPDRIELAKRLSPNLDFRCGDASKLPYEDNYFNIVLQFTVFTSILDARMKRDIAEEMKRVLRHDGIIIWYDFFVDNLKNSDVKGVKKKDIYELFPHCNIYLKRITLAPPLTRIIAPYSILTCYFLEKIIILNTHYFGIIRKDHGL